mmetsp:Transcript_11574/g.34619  ORF Transcript_11574/g.34619 Transcript_11574/m.34619 type:complete len:465 (+) Transcript_11574:303-1697(+)
MQPLGDRGRVLAAVAQLHLSGEVAHRLRLLPHLRLELRDARILRCHDAVAPLPARPGRRLLLEGRELTAVHLAARQQRRLRRLAVDTQRLQLRKSRLRSDLRPLRRPACRGAHLRLRHRGRLVPGVAVGERRRRRRRVVAAPPRGRAVRRVPTRGGRRRGVREVGQIAQPNALLLRVGFRRRRDLVVVVAALVVLLVPPPRPLPLARLAPSRRLRSGDRRARLGGGRRRLLLRLYPSQLLLLDPPLLLLLRRCIDRRARRRFGLLRLELGADLLLEPQLLGEPLPLLLLDARLFDRSQPRRLRFLGRPPLRRQPFLLLALERRRRLLDRDALRLDGGQPRRLLRLGRLADRSLRLLRLETRQLLRLQPQRLLFLEHRLLLGAAGEQLAVDARRGGAAHRLAHRLCVRELRTDHSLERARRVAPLRLGRLGRRLKLLHPHRRLGQQRLPLADGVDRHHAERARRV